MSEQHVGAFMSINLGSTGTKTFSSFEEFQQWRDKEREFWKWLPEVRREDSYIVSQVENQLDKFYAPIDQLLSEARSLKEEALVAAKAKQIAAHIQAQIHRKSIVFSGSPEGDFLGELRQDNPRIAAHTVGAMIGLHFNTSMQESLEGQFLGIAFRHGYRDRTKSERAALQNLQAEWAELLSQSKATFEASSKQYDDLGNQYREQIASQRSAFGELTSASQGEFKTLVGESQKQLKIIEKTYDEKLAVQASVLYWKNKAASHGRAATKLAWASGIVSSIVAIFLGVETFLAVGPLQKVSDLPLWKAAMLLLTAIIGVWSIRVLVRLLLSNLHLKSDAVERRTMLLTYLALLRRGQGPEEEHRELILQILFRPSTTGIIKDDALPPIVAQWLNTITS
jgi:hypothetical protein